MSLPTSTLLEVVERIVGTIEPVGDTAIDTHRLVNLKAWAALTVEMVGALVSLANDNRTSHCASVREAVSVARAALKEIRFEIEEMP
jgi:hypothetical protein